MRGSIGGMTLALMVAVAAAGCGKRRDSPSSPDDRGVTRADESAAEYTLGVFPHLPPNMMSARCGELAAVVAEGIGARVQPRTASTYETFFDRLEEQRYDFALVQPFDYVRLEPGKYEPVARMDVPLRAVFAVAPDSALNGVQDLRSVTIAMPPEGAAVSYLARGHLRAAGLAPDRDLTIQYTRNHASCLQQVMSGAAAVCVTTDLPLAKIAGQMGVAFRVIGKTDAIPHILFVVRAALPDDVKQRARATVIALGDTEEGRGVLKRADLEPFVPATDADYDPVRAVFAASEKVD